MKKASDISRTAVQLGQVGANLRRLSFVLFISFLVLGALTIGLGGLYIDARVFLLGLFVYLSGMLATVVFIGLFVVLSLYCRTEKALPKVLAALYSTLKRDPDPRVRSKAAEGLAELDLEEFSRYHKHNKLDTILVSTLKRDPDPHVRSKAAEGLAELELEEFSYRCKNKKLDDILFRDDL